MKTKYAIKAHETFYEGVIFRSRLEARWAAFFDILGWKWEYEPIDIDGWTPDFMVTFPCGHSECGGSHSLLVEIKPYYNIKEFEGHPCMDYPYGGYEKRIPADASAAFGINPHITHWEMAHGAGSGWEKIENWIDDVDIDAAWKAAGTMTRYNPNTTYSRPR